MELHGRNYMKLTQGLQAPQHPVPNLLLVPQPTLKLNNPALTLSCVPVTDLTIYFSSPSSPARQRKGQPKPFLGPPCQPRQCHFYIS